MLRSAGRAAVLALTLFLMMGLGISQDREALKKRVGDKLACLCGACNNTVHTCPMLHCHYSDPARQQISQMVDEGKSEQEILDAFIAKEGLRALAEPPREGFHMTAFVMPGIAVVLGLILVGIAIQRLRHHPAPVTGPRRKVDPEALARYQEQIDRDLEKMD